MFLPPHSPGFSPIEEAFSKAKALLRKAVASTREPMGRTVLDVVRSRETSPEHLESAVREAVARGLVRRKLMREELSRLEDDGRRRIAEQAINEAMV